jgi:V8-like Glu-specific endopeptidase
MRKSLILMLVLGLLGWVAVEQSTAQLSNDATEATALQVGDVTVLTVPNTAAQMGPEIDFVNAEPMPLPKVQGRSEAGALGDLINALMTQPGLGEVGSVPGETGTGEMSLVRLGAPNASAPDAGGVTPEEFGTTNHPFSTAQADLFAVPTNTFYPYRASGKLFVDIGTGTATCSASLIARGVVVTAAHCVAIFGQQQFFFNWLFVPGYRNGVAPFGGWTVSRVAVLTSYLNGTDPCAVPGLVCANDVAVLLLNASGGAYPGTATGWYGFGFDGFGFTPGALTQITQIGYPGCLDNGDLMERNDSFGFRSSSLSNNTLIGSLMCEGASGGPWLVNFGIRPVLTGTTAGTAPNPNSVVGVLSWGFVSPSPKQGGASPFTSGNILLLFNAVCGLAPAACS